jgi:hypothetical protein
MDDFKRKNIFFFTPSCSKNCVDRAERTFQSGPESPFREKSRHRTERRRAFWTSATCGRGDTALSPPHRRLAASVTCQQQASKSATTVSLPQQPRAPGFGPASGRPLAAAGGGPEPSFSRSVQRSSCGRRAAQIVTSVRPALNPESPAAARRAGVFGTAGHEPGKNLSHEFASFRIRSHACASN